MQERPWLRHYDTWTPRELQYPKVPAQELMRNTANLLPDKPALSFFGAPMTYAQLFRASVQMAHALAGLGVQRGDRVALHLPNCPQYVIAYYATLHLGAVVVNLNPLYTPPEMKHMLELTTPKVMFSFDLVLPNVRTLLTLVEPFQVVATALTDFAGGPVSTPQSLDLPAGWLHFSTLMNSATSTKIPRSGVGTMDPAMILFTGGTTGLPKGAVVTHGNLMASTACICMWSEGTNRLVSVERRTVMGVLPLFHIYSQICCLHYAMATGSTLYLVPRFVVDEFMATLERIPEITFFPTVPTLANAIVNHPRTPELGLDRKIKLLNNGGGPMALELIHQTMELGISFSEGWGMTETTSLGIANPTNGLKKAGSIGIPMVGGDVKLVDVAQGGEEVPVGQPGEIVIKSPIVMQGYWQNPEETAKTIQDGWLYTGDVAIKDEDGYIFIVDRKKDMIIAGGYNIYPREVDEVLFQHPKVAEAISLGVPDQYRGETVKAYVVPKPGETITEEEIVAFCKERLAAYKVPKQVEFRDTLPRSAVGKLLRRALRDEEIAKQKGGK